MSAPALNIAASPIPGPAIGNGVAAPSGQGQGTDDPAAAFGTVMASLFGVADATSGQAGKTPVPTSVKSDSGKILDSDADDIADSDGTDAAGPAVPDAALALLSATIAVPLVVPAPAPTPIAASAQTPGAGGETSEQVAAAPTPAFTQPAPDPTPPAAAKAAAPVADDTVGTLPELTAKPAPAPLAAAANVEVKAPPTAAAPPPTTSAPATVTLPPAAAETTVAATVPPPATPAPASASSERKSDAKSAPRVEANRAPTAPGAVAVAGQANDTAPALVDAVVKVAGDKASADDAAPQIVADAADGPARPADVNTVTQATTTPATLVQAAALAVRGSPQTVANLAAQIIKKLEGRSTQFDVQLDPAGLGKVDVKVHIGADGRISAAMSFDNPQAAADVKSRANELHSALQQAGFDVTGGLSFDVAGDTSGQGRDGWRQDNDQSGASFRGRAFQTALDTVDDAPPLNGLSARASRLSGVDIRI